MFQCIKEVLLLLTNRKSVKEIVPTFSEVKQVIKVETFNHSLIDR